jgi:tripartite-type tricarboxylate transporter receptor subunit TctC
MRARCVLFSCCMLLASSLLVAAQSGAETFPSKPVRIVVPQAPGGASDALARIMAQRLTERWKQQVVVENRPGAGGNIGTEAVAKAPADGYTLLLGYVGTHAINVSLYASLGWDPVKDFTPIATLATVPFALVVNAQLPVTTVADFIGLAKARAGGLTYASAGNGSVNHLLGEMFNAGAGVKLVHVPYKGAAPALTDLMGGQVQSTFTSLPSVAQHVRSGAVRALAVTSARRSESFPNLPTLAESGLTGFDVNPWFGVLAPAGTPREIVEKIHADVNAVLAEKDLKERFAASGADVFVTSLDQFAELLRADIQKWAAVVKASGAKID